MSAFIEKLTFWLEILPARQQAMLIAIAGVILLSALYLLILPAEQERQASNNSVAPNGIKPKPAQSQPVMPARYPVQTMRDPFAPPSGFGKSVEPPFTSAAAQQTGKNAANAGLIVPQEAQKEILPLLVGVVSGGNRKMAIINYHNSSQAYYSGQAIGPYKLVEIHTDSVVIHASGEQRVLSMGVKKDGVLAIGR